MHQKLWFLWKCFALGFESGCGDLPIQPWAKYWSQTLMSSEETPEFTTMLLSGLVKQGISFDFLYSSLGKPCFHIPSVEESCWNMFGGKIHVLYGWGYVSGNLCVIGVMGGGGGGGGCGYGGAWIYHIAKSPIGVQLGWIWSCYHDNHSVIWAGLSWKTNV